MLLGVVFHAGFSFLPGLPPGSWAIQDRDPSRAVAVVLFTSHTFRLSLFFFIAGFFARMTFHRRGMRGFAADRARRILAPLVVGWLAVYPALREVWIWGAKKTVWAPLTAPSGEAPPAPPGAFPMTHLWFLYYLLVLYVIVLACRAGVVALDPDGSRRRTVDQIVRSAVETGAAALFLALPVSAVLYFRDEMLWFGVPSPDRSLVPEGPSLVAYGTALAAGWLVQRQGDLLPAWIRQWPLHLAVAVLATLVCLAIVGVSPTSAPLPEGLEKLAYVGAFGLATWCWSFAVIGLGLKLVPATNPVVRYLADSSYWIYLAHLPIVVACQVKVGLWPWPWAVKFPLVLAASLTVLMASYHLLVRSTFIGGTLNGRRYPLAGAPALRQLLRLGARSSAP